MKILILTPYYYPKIGGLENYVNNLTNQLARKAHCDIVVVTSNHISNSHVCEQIDGIKVYRLPRKFLISNTPVNINWFFDLKKIIKQEEPDLINAHTPVPFLSDIGAIAAGKIPFVLTYHAVSLYKNNSPIMNFFIFIYRHLIEQFTFNKASAVIAVSSSVKKTFSDRNKAKTLIIPNSIKQSSILDTKLKSKLSNQLLFISNLDASHSWKGLDDILNSIQYYRNTYKKRLKLIVIGSGNRLEHYMYRAKLLQIEDQVLFIGEISNEIVLDALRKSSILLTYPNTSNDAFPTVFLEAWASFTPIISSNIRPINEIIAHMKNGILVDLNDISSFANFIHKLQSDTALYSKIAVNGNRCVREFTWERQAKKTYALFESVL